MRGVENKSKRREVIRGEGLRGESTARHVRIKTKNKSGRPLSKVTPLKYRGI